MPWYTCYTLELAHLAVPVAKNVDFRSNDLSRRDWLNHFNRNDNDAAHGDTDVFLLGSRSANDVRRRMGVTAAPTGARARGRCSKYVTSAIARGELADIGTAAVGACEQDWTILHCPGPSAVSARANARHCGQARAGCDRGRRVATALPLQPWAKTVWWL